MAFALCLFAQVGSYLQVLSGPLRPSVWGGVFSCSAETVRRCRTIVVDEEEREQKASETKSDCVISTVMQRVLHGDPRFWSFAHGE